MQIRVRPTRESDLASVQRIAVAAEMFGDEEVGFLAEVFSTPERPVPGEHRWIVAEDADGTVVGAADVAPEPFADRMWNMYFVAVDPSIQGRGVGTALVVEVERWLRAQGTARARTLVVETSSTDAFVRARSFYERRAFDEEARIRDFYGPADDKVVFWKSLT